jgi:glycosyltransferase involved in cell wall biosynthesis
MPPRDFETVQSTSSPLLGKSVLFISYNGMLDPLGQSQVLPYLRQLAQRGVRFFLLSFERSGAFQGEGLREREALRADLARENIEWHVLRYHQRPSLPATAYDVLIGILVAKQLIRKNRIELVHARSHIPASMALSLKRLTRLKMIFDLRGLMAEEYVEANHWREGGLPYRLTKIVESRALAAADGVVTLTKKIWPIIRDWNGLRGRKVVHEVIPCCADLDVFNFSLENRNRRRNELDLGDRLTLVYSGSIGGWYLAKEMGDFFVQLLTHRVDAHFLWLTAGDPDVIHRVMRERKIGAQSYTIRKIAPPDMPSYLAAADVGIAFYKPGLSRLATSPVKLTEYLACGLPVVLNSGIGDSDEILSDSGVGAIVSRFDDAEYTRAWREIECALINRHETRTRASQLARRLFDLREVGAERYARLYQRVLAGS